MELSVYLTPLRRWWWLLVASTLVATVSSFLATLNQAPVYEARATLMIGRVIEDPNPNQGEIYLAQSLAQTYADIANREPVRNATMQALGLTWLPSYLARALPQTQLIEITVTDVNPLRAQVVANELANQLLLRSPTSSGSEDQERQRFIDMQLSTLEAQIQETQDEIARLQEQLGTLNSARQLQDTETQIATLQTRLTTLQGNYAALLANTSEGATNTLTVVEAAELPTVPIGPNKLMTIALSAAIGFSLAAGAAYLLEYLDDTLKTPEEITRILGLPVLGLIGEMGEDGNRKDGVYVAQNPRSPIAEAYRNLRANLEFTEVDKPLKTIMVTSANTDAGKSSVAANLAVVLAHTEKDVWLIDADLRKSSIHKYTRVSNQIGLSDLLQRNGKDLSGALQYWDDGKVSVITSGASPPNPAELLGSQRMENILEKVKEKADVVVIDSPPLVVSDPLILSAKVDGIILVIRPGQTRKKMVVAMMEQLNRVHARVLGVVINRIPHRSAEYYGGYVYNSPYYTNYHYNASDDQADSLRLIRHRLGKIFMDIFHFGERLVSGVAQRSSKKIIKPDTIKDGKKKVKPDKSRKIQTKIRPDKKKMVKNKVDDLKIAIDLSSNPTERIRLQSVLLRKMGYQFDDIENITGCSRSDLIYWEESFDQGGLEALMIAGGEMVLPEAGQHGNADEKS